MSNAQITSHGIAKRLIFATILLSSLLTLVITAFQLLSEYNKEIARIENNYDQMQLTYLPSLTQSLWVFDDIQTGKILDGLLRIPEFEHISVTQNGDLKWQRGRRQSKRFSEETKVMTVQHNNEEYSVGNLKIVIGLDGVYSDLLNQALTILLANGVKTFFVAGFMLFLIYNLVTRHLFKVVNYANSQDFGQNACQAPPLKLDRKQRKDAKPDELEQLEYAINSMYERLCTSNLKLVENEKELVNYRDRLEETIKERTGHLVVSKEEAIRANAAKTEFLSRMSHELRTPMNAVLGFAQLLVVDDELNEAQKSYVQDILIAGEHLLDLINEVLDLTRIESGNIKVQLGPVSLHQVVFESVATVELMAQKKGIIIENKIDEHDEIRVYAERQYLKEAILNLLTNAIKYNREKGSVSILYNILAQGWVTLQVIDSGMGIATEKQPSVFEPFARLGAEYTDVQGTGIGLTIARRLVELMGAKIGFRSQENKGSCFYIYLPVYDSKEEATPGDESA